ncbi:bifunctional proline dehydrogenase/L-glutamate gamma-semialdehyde dehydrogenase PutA, partial [bacterium AH-315-P15]|nr:bifunctional proline dehydrogenase/L-glutamate gamma-semialdehyde dehydrogenase PutA [bacterium AH-315-P15]
LYLFDETQLAEQLISAARLSPDEREITDHLARRLTDAIRSGRTKEGSIDAFLQEYSLSSEEGVVLMCLAEALLRIPDDATADRLIRDKIGSGDWGKHMGQSDSLFVNASTWGLMLTGRVVRLHEETVHNAAAFMKRLVNKSGEPVIRQSMLQAMRIMGKQFVRGRTMKEALKEGKSEEARGVRFSFDMLGEGAHTQDDAERYFEAYRQAVAELADARPAKEGDSIFARPSISVKLSAIHPRFEEAKRARVFDELLPRLTQLAAEARAGGLSLTVDAEETERLEISLEIFAAVLAEEALEGWDGLGLAVQAYQKRAGAVIDGLAAMAKRHGRRLPIRLVKGAYWDTEIKHAQIAGLEGYPVFTRKAMTDVSYLACARKLLADPECFYPQFATHNAHTVAAIRAIAGPDAEYEMQRLHGMGDALYDEIMKNGLDPGKPGGGASVPLRIYAPVGSHEDLLAYLVRRLLENGANTSFVNRLADDEAPIEEIIADPVEKMAGFSVKPHPRIPTPRELYLPRKNAKGVLITEQTARAPFIAAALAAVRDPCIESAIIGGENDTSGTEKAIHNPADRRYVVGRVTEASAGSIERAMALSHAGQIEWDRRGGAARAEILERAADLFEAEMPKLVGLCVKEAGKTFANGIADVREAIDFLRYYAERARIDFESAQRMPGPTGETNDLLLRGRGTFACIAPWNFPVAIFTGQVAAALASGNAVIAKPAAPTPLTAATVIRLLLKAGVPGDVLHFTPGAGRTIGGVLTADERVSGIVFTGSTGVAKTIQRGLAAREGAIVPFIAETGGQNCMVVDSTALPEQVTVDVLASAFDSAGQRCSALRVLYVQDDIADRVIPMITGAMDELTVGDPADYATDIGPVIDRGAQEGLEAHIERMRKEATLLRNVDLSHECAYGTFVAPHAFEIDGIDVLTGEVFGPVLHVVRYQADRLGAVCDAINSTGFGLTLGVHSRIKETARFIRERVHAGNIYVNRNQIGAVVGVQPFGGEGLSGTGPKAGGPYYLHRMAKERAISEDTTASGGNTSLMTMNDEDDVSLLTAPGE